MSTPNRNDALAAHRRLTNLHGASDDSRLVYTFLSSLPPPPFTLPPPGTEFTVRIRGQDRLFYRTKTQGLVAELSPQFEMIWYTEGWLREAGAEIVEGQP